MQNVILIILGIIIAIIGFSVEGDFSFFLIGLGGSMASSAFIYMVTSND